jgi:hypothetical protein
MTGSDEVFVRVKEGLKVNSLLSDLVSTLKQFELPESFSPIEKTITIDDNEYQVVVENPYLAIHVISEYHDIGRVLVYGNLKISNEYNEILSMDDLLLGDSNTDLAVDTKLEMVKNKLANGISNELGTLISDFILKYSTDAVNMKEDIHQYSY